MKAYSPLLRASDNADAFAIGSGSPGGATTQIQYNNAGAFGGSAAFTYDVATADFVLNGTNTNITMKGSIAEPAAAPAGTLHIYTKALAGRLVPKVKGPNGLDYPLQSALWQNSIVTWECTGLTAGFWRNTVGTSAGTFTNGLPADTSLLFSMKRARYANVVTTLQQVLGLRTTEASFFRGSAIAKAGGFFFFARFGADTWTNGARLFAGMHTATTVISADPSALNDTVGFCVDAADNGAISFLTRGTAATKASTGLTIASNKVYDCFIYCTPDSSEYTWRIVDLTTGTEASGTATATLPARSTKLSVGVLASNAALTPVTSVNLAVTRIYVETEY